MEKFKEIVGFLNVGCKGLDNGLDSMNAET